VTVVGDDGGTGPVRRGVARSVGVTVVGDDGGTGPVRRGVAVSVNFTIAVYSPTNITSLFYPVSKLSYFCICDNPLNCYHFTSQSHPFAHVGLTSFRRLQNSLTKTRLIRNS